MNQLGSQYDPPGQAEEIVFQEYQQQPISYKAPSSFCSDSYYDIGQIKHFEEDDTLIELKDAVHTGKASQLHTYYCYYWMKYLTELEIELKGIILGRAVFNPDISQYVNKRVLGILEAIFDKVNTDNNKLKIQCYMGEILMMVQHVCLIIWKQHPQISLMLLKKIHTQNLAFYDSRFKDITIFRDALNNFYGERLHRGVRSEVEGYPNQVWTELYNSKSFYPLKNEILETFRMSQDPFNFSPFQRMQINYFYQNGGFSLIADALQNFNLNYLDVFDILAYFNSYMDKQIYINYFHQFRLIELQFSEEEIKNTNREMITRLINGMEKLLEPLHSQTEKKKYLALIEMNIYLQCYRCTSLEKRIYGLQQFCDKINVAHSNEYIVSQNYSNDEWYTNENVLNFLVQNQIFSELFGQKAHFELIKRCFPITQFLYIHKQLSKEEILSILKLGRGKHETWANMISKVMADLAEILSLDDIETLIEYIQQHQIDQNVLSFIKSLGRNKNIRVDLSSQKSKKQMKQIGLCQDYTPNLQNRQPGKRKYEDNAENEYVGEMQIEEPEIQVVSPQIEAFKAQIVEFLLNIVHDQPKTEIGKSSFSIAMNMICNNFKSLRKRYLVHCFESLLAIHQPLSIQSYIQLIQKIIQSAYPLEQFQNSEQLIEWIQDTYDYKTNLLKVLAREKLRSFNDIPGYLETMECLIKFYQFLNQNSKITSTQLNMLWKLLVENALTQQEQDLFFQWLGNTNKKFLDQEATELLFFLLIKCRPLTEPMFQCLTNLILHYNVQYRIMKCSMDYYTILDQNIIGIDVIWNVFFRQKELADKVQQFLIKILRFKQNQNILNELKKNYLVKLFEQIDNSSSLSFIVKLLEEFEGYKLAEQGEKVFVTIDNKCFEALPPKRQDIQLLNGLQVLQAKLIIGQKLNPPLKPNEFDILCRGILFDDHKTLKDYKVNQKLTFIISKREILTDEVSAYNAISDQICNNDFEPNDAEENILEICAITEIQDKDFIKYVLKDKNWDKQNAVLELIERGDQLKIEYSQKHGDHKKPLKQQKQQNVGEVCFASLISDQYVDQLFQILNFENSDSNQKIWSILQMIPRNKKVYIAIEEAQTKGDWSQLIDVENTYRLHYNLQILKEQLQCDFIEEEEEYYKRKNLRESFLRQGGLLQLLQQLFNSNEIVMLILDIIQIYFTAYAISQSADPNEFNQLLKLKSTVQSICKEEDPKISSLLSLPVQQSEKANIAGYDEATLLQQQFRLNEIKFNIDLERLLGLVLEKMGIEQVYTIILIIFYMQPQLLKYELPPLKLLAQLANTSEEQRKMAAIFIMTAQEIGKRHGVNLGQQMLKTFLSGETQYDELYLVISGLIGQADQLSFVDTHQLASQIILFILNRGIVEERFSENEDKLLQGSLLLLTSLVQVDQTIQLNSQFTLHIYGCLFEMHNDYYKYPVFKRKLTRRRAYYLLLECCKNQDNLLSILPFVQQNHQVKAETGEQEIDLGVKGAHGFVGLRNLGATCYINSLLQQFYMNKQLRRGILNGQLMVVEMQAPLVFDNVKQIDSQFIQKRLQEHTLHQLQLVFIQLQESVKQYINPHPFIKTLKGYDGEHINVLVQQDCNEFFNLLTDKLEQDQKHTNQANLIHKILGGALGHEIKSLEDNCEFQSEKEEPFLTVSIEIKNKKSLEEALDLFVKADVLDGENKYFCEDVNKKIDVQKRCYFKKLPNTFIIHLKRFEFDFNTMLRIKVNDYFEFPLEFNMFKWTRDHLVEAKELQDYSEYQYILKGVLVHTGSAEGGHYYSFIRDQDKWFEFNDKLITPFKIENLKQECFGGDGSSNLTDWGMCNSKNAYILFYEKVKCEIEQEIEVENSNEDILRQQIIADNTVYLKNQLFYAQDYLKFIQKLFTLFIVKQPFPVSKLLSTQMNQEQLENIQEFECQPSLQLIKMFTLFTHETIIKNKDIQMFQANMQQLSDMLKSEPAANFWLLQFLINQKQYVIDLLIESSFSDVRSVFAQLIIQAITIVAEYEKNYLENEVSIVNRFFKFYFDSLLVLVKSTLRRGTEYFQVIKFSVISAQRVVRFFINQEYFKKIYNLLSEQLVNAQGANIFKLQVISTNNIDAPMAMLGDIIAKCVMSCRTTGMMITQMDAPTYLFKGEYGLDIDQFWLNRLLNSEDFKKYILPMVQFQPSMIEMIKHICWKDINISEQVMTIMVAQMLDFFMEWQSIDNIGQVIEALLKMEDDLQQVRLISLLQTPPKAMFQNKGTSLINAIIAVYDTDKNYSFCLIALFANLAHQIPFVKDYYKQNRDTFEFMLYKAQEYRNIAYGLYFPTQKIIKSINQLSAIFEDQPQQCAIPVVDGIQEEPEPELEYQMNHLIEENRNNYAQPKEGSLSNHASAHGSDTEELPSQNFPDE